MLNLIKQLTQRNSRVTVLGSYYIDYTVNFNESSNFPDAKVNSAIYALNGVFNLCRFDYFINVRDFTFIRKVANDNISAALQYKFKANENLNISAIDVYYNNETKQYILAAIDTTNSAHLMKIVSRFDVRESLKTFKGCCKHLHLQLGS